MSTNIANARTIIENQIKETARGSARVYDLIRAEAEVILATGHPSSLDPALKYIASKPELHYVPIYADEHEPHAQADSLLKRLAIAASATNDKVHRWGAVTDLVIPVLDNAANSSSLIQALIVGTPSIAEFKSPLYQLIERLDAFITSAELVDIRCDQQRLVRDALSAEMQILVAPLVFGEFDGDRPSVRWAAYFVSETIYSFEQANGAYGFDNYFSAI